VAARDSDMLHERNDESGTWGVPVAVWGILLLACLLRGTAVLLRFENLYVDRDAYLAIAENLLNGHGFCSTIEQPTAFRPPLYPILVAVCLRMGGFAALGIAQVILGTATVWLTWRLTGLCRLSWRVGAVATFLVAVDPLLIEYTTQAMTETLSTFLVTLLLWGTLRGGPSVSKSVGVGTIFGLAALCRPSIWAFGGVASAFWMISMLVKRTPASSSSDRRSRTFTLAFVCTVATLLVVSPWVIRNAIQFGQPILMTTHGGYTLLLGNNETFYDEVVAAERGSTWGASSLAEWQAANERRLSALGISRLDEPARDRALSGFAREWITSNPLRFLQSSVLRFQRFWALRPSHSAVPSWLAQLAGAYYSGVFTLALIGLVRWRNRILLCWTVPAMVLALTLVHFVYWSNARMRSAVVPAISLVAAAAFQRSRDAHVAGIVDTGAVDLEQES
jgi:hypothetical protein